MGSCFLMASSSPAGPVKTTFFFLFFKEIIDYLFEEKLPEFEEKLESRKGKQLSSADSTDNQQKKVFRFSDVFDSSEESDDSLKNN